MNLKLNLTLIRTLRFRVRVSFKIKDRVRFWISFNLNPRSFDQNDRNLLILKYTVL